ncbi:MAG: ABC transporter substrate-binding protein [Bacillota bacterium]
MVAMTGSPPVLDPAIGWAHLTAIVGLHVMEDLLTYDEEYAIIPQLAEDYYANDDYTEWTFELRQGIPFHNGQELTSRDVAASFWRTMEVSPRASDFSSIEDIRLEGDHQLTLLLSKPEPVMPALIANPLAGVPVFPADVLDEVEEGEHITVEQYIGTGPFRIDEWLPDEYLRLVRFEDYSPDTRLDGPTGLGGNRTAHLDEVELVPVPESGSRVAGIITGDYHWAQDLPKIEYYDLEGNPDVQTGMQKAQWAPLVYFNTKEPPMDDVRMRRAVQAVFNHDEIMLAAAELEEFYRLCSSFFFQEQVWYCPVGEEMGLYDQRDPERARELADEAGYNGEEMVFLATSDYEWMYRGAMVMTEQLRKAGFNFDLQVYDWSTMIAMREEPWHLNTSGDTIPFDGSYLNYWHTEQDFLGHSNPRIDDILDRGMQHTDFDTRYEIYCELSRALYEELPYIKLGDMHELHAQTNDVQGFVPYWIPRFWNVWIEE